MAQERARHAPSPRQYRRRILLVKQGFQLRFALYPLALLLVFLVCGWGYLYGELSEILEYQLYLPHSELQNPWTEVWPAVLRVVLVGGGAFLAALGVWSARRFSRLKNDLLRLENWPAEDEGFSLRLFREPEVRGLAEKLERARHHFDDWEARARRTRREAQAALEAARAAPDDQLVARLADARNLWRKHWDVLGEVRVDESLS